MNCKHYYYYEVMDSEGIEYQGFATNDWGYLPWSKAKPDIIKDIINNYGSDSTIKRIIKVTKKDYLNQEIYIR